MSRRCWPSGSASRSAVHRESSSCAVSQAWAKRNCFVGCSMRRGSAGSLTSWGAAVESVDVPMLAAASLMASIPGGTEALVPDDSTLGPSGRVGIADSHTGGQCGRSSGRAWIGRAGDRRLAVGRRGNACVGAASCGGHRDLGEAALIAPRRDGAGRRRSGAGPKGSPSAGTRAVVSERARRPARRGRGSGALSRT